MIHPYLACHCDWYVSLSHKPWFTVVHDHLIITNWCRSSSTAWPAAMESHLFCCLVITCSRLVFILETIVEIVTSFFIFFFFGLGFPLWRVFGWLPNEAQEFFDHPATLSSANELPWGVSLHWYFIHIPSELDTIKSDWHPKAPSSTLHKILQKPVTLKPGHSSTCDGAGCWDWDNFVDLPCSVMFCYMYISRPRHQSSPVTTSHICIYSQVYHHP